MSDDSDYLKKLPEDEWCFGKAIESHGLDMVYLYEYSREAARSSEEFVSLVRKARACFSRTLMSKYRGYVTDRRQAADDVLRHPLAPFLTTVLANVEGLREYPLIKNPDIKKWSKVWPLGFGHPAIPLVALDVCQWPEPTNLTTDMLEPESDQGGFYIFTNMYRRKEPSVPRDHGFNAYAMFEINWASSDTDIVKHFKDFLVSNRPPRFRESRKGHDKQKGMHIEMPTINRESALRWLSISRRYSAHRTTFEGLREIGYDDLGEDDQYRFQSGCSNAEAIVRFFVKGGRLSTRKHKGKNKSEYTHIDLKYVPPDFPV